MLKPIRLSGVQLLITLIILIILQILVYKVVYVKRDCTCPQNENLTNNKNLLTPTEPPVADWERTLNFAGFHNDTGTPDGHYIIPNYVHFIKLGFATFNFIHMICVLAAFKHQQPEKLFIHTDVEEFSGEYWEVLINTPGLKEVLVVNRVERPTAVFGQPLNSQWANFHAGDVVRLTIMRKYGGIYLDNDSYLIRNMNDLRRYEMVVAWRPGLAMMNQVVLAHKDARLLMEWQEGYKNYKSDMWYFNAGRYPANVLLEKPHLAHTMKFLLGTYDIRGKIYSESKKWDWRTYYSCHLMVRWMTNFRGIRYPNPITEVDVLKYDNALLEMVADVYDLQKKREEKDSANKKL